MNSNAGVNVTPPPHHAHFEIWVSKNPPDQMSHPGPLGHSLVANPLITPTSEVGTLTFAILGLKNLYKLPPLGTHAVEPLFPACSACSCGVCMCVCMHACVYVLGDYINSCRIMSCFYKIVDLCTIPSTRGPLLSGHNLNM